MSRVKKFEEFSSVNEEFSFDSLKNFLGGLLPSLGSGFTKTLKQKLAAVILEKFGIEENSELSIIVQEFVDQIPPTDIPGIISGEKATPEYFAPRMAGFVQEYVQRKGLDTIATKLGIKPTGWIYSTLRETLQEQIGKERLTKFFLQLFGSETAGIGKEALMGLDPKSKEMFSSALYQRAGQGYSKPSGIKQQQTGSKSSWGGFEDFFSGLLQGAKNNQS